MQQKTIAAKKKTIVLRTLVIPIAPTFSLYDVVPVPVPQKPARTQPIPSTVIPAKYGHTLKEYTTHTNVRRAGNRCNHVFYVPPFGTVTTWHLPLFMAWSGGGGAPDSLAHA